MSAHKGHGFSFGSDFESGFSEPPQAKSTAKTKKRNRNLLKFTEYSFYAIAGLLAFFSATPWIEVGHLIGNEIVLTRFYTALLNLPIIGLLFMFLKWFLLNALGVGLWFLINLIQVAPTLLGIPPIYKAIVDYSKSNKQPESDDPTIAKLQRKISNWLLNVFYEIGKWSAISYLFELAVNLAYFAPYKGGWMVFIKDAPVWSVDKILFVQLGLMIASIAAIEMLVGFCIAVWRIFHTIK